MVAEEFFTLATKFKLSTYVGVEDFADKLSFLFSVMFLILSMMVVTIKSYFFKPLACYIATPPSGINFENFLENYCWVHGTITILPGETFPDGNKAWYQYDNEKRITYYQWVPFILGLQCIMFYMPRAIWELICYSKAGTDLQALANKAHDAANQPPMERKGTVEDMACVLEDLLYQHRDYRTGNIASMRRTVFKACNFCICSKHLGTWMVLSYLLVKCLYALNVISQLFIMKQFLGFNESITGFGIHVLSNMINGLDWHQTGIFPRVTYCYLDNIRHLGASNEYVAQCALPVNMLNEKIYIFLWFWVLFVGVITVISIPLWFIRLASLSRRTSFIKKFLQMSDSYQRSDKPLMSRFINEFLRHDGVFLLRMIFINAGDLITADLVKRLWTIYKERYSNCDLGNCIKRDLHQLHQHMSSSGSTEDDIHPFKGGLADNYV